MRRRSDIRFAAIAMSVRSTNVYEEGGIFFLLGFFGQQITHATT